MSEEIPEQGISEFTQLCHYIATKLRMCFKQPPEKEKEVQDAIEILLKARDYLPEREKHSIPLSTKFVRPDFVIEDLNTAIEIKFTNSEKKRQRVVDDISSDIHSYSKQYKKLIFIIYDVGTIQDESEFRRGLENNNIRILIIKH